MAEFVIHHIFYAIPRCGGEHITESDLIALRAADPPFCVHFSEFNIGIFGNKFFKIGIYLLASLIYGYAAYLGEKALESLLFQLCIRLILYKKYDYKFIYYV